MKVYKRAQKELEENEKKRWECSFTWDWDQRLNSPNRIILINSTTSRYLQWFRSRMFYLCTTNFSFPSFFQWVPVPNIIFIFFRPLTLIRVLFLFFHLLKFSRIVPISGQPALISTIRERSVPLWVHIYQNIGRISGTWTFFFVVISFIIFPYTYFHWITVWRKRFFHCAGGVRYKYDATWILSPFFTVRFLFFC